MKKLFKTLNNYAILKLYIVETVDKLRNRCIKIGSTTGYKVIMPDTSKQGYTPDFCIAYDEVANGRPYSDMIN